jgi:hypothetical protein
MLLNLWLPLSSGALEGIGRYCSGRFPCFIWLVSLRSPTLFTAPVICFSMPNPRSGAVRVTFILFSDDYARRASD